MFKVIEFLSDHDIPYSTDSPNLSSQGWVAVRCPFCSDRSDHGALHPQYEAYNCWKCGRHDLRDYVHAVLDTGWNAVNAIMRRYRTGDNRSHTDDAAAKTAVEKTVVLPPHQPLYALPGHCRYLRGRGFDPLYLAKIYAAVGTDFSAGSYKYRVIAPIHLNGRLVSYQGRDITGQQVKYRACAKTDEAVAHKHICYGADMARGRRVVVVEGVFDAWRLGPGAVATFGTAWTREQLQFLSRTWEEFFILYDAEDGAQQQARTLAHALAGLGHCAEVVSLSAGDPGDMSQGDANNLMKDLLA